MVHNRKQNKTAKTTRNKRYLYIQKNNTLKKINKKLENYGKGLECLQMLKTGELN